MFKRVLLACALSLAGVTTASASWISQDVHLRNGPGTHHHSRGVLTVCTNVSVHDHHRGWLRVDSHDGHGWVRARYVSDHRPAGCGRRHARQVIVDPHPYVHVRPRVEIIIGHGHWPRHHHRRLHHGFGPDPNWQNDW